MPVPDHPPRGPERVTLFYCDAHGWTDRVFAHTDRWYCRACFDANPDAACAPVETVEYVPRSLAVELAEALETARWWVNAARRERPSAQLALEKSDAVLSKAKDAGLLGADDG